MNERGPLVAVVDHDAANFADAALFGRVVGGAVAGVPGGLVVDQHMDVALARDFADGQGIFDGDGEGLLHHGGDAVFAREFNGRTMAGNGGVDQQSLRMGGLDHGLGVGIEQAGRHVESFCVAGGQGRIGLGNADQLDVVVQRNGMKKAADVAMHEAHNGDARGRGLGLGREHTGNSYQQSQQQHAGTTERETGRKTRHIRVVPPGAQLYAGNDLQAGPLRRPAPGLAAPAGSLGKGNKNRQFEAEGC